MQMIHGKVVKGKGEGRVLGYPTANLEYECEEQPESGVWACHVKLGSREIKGLAVIGMWSLQDGRPSLEIHLLDFDQNVYGQEIQVEFLEKLRALQKFSDVASLVKQIEDDIAQAHQLF